MSIKIYLADNQGTYRTTQQLKKHWETDPRFILDADPYWNPLKAEWADVIWVEWTETAIQLASKRGGKGGENEFKDIRLNHILQPDKEKYDWSGKLLINRMIDIESYYGHYRSVKWQNVDYLTYIAKHIFKRVDDDVQFAKTFPNLKTLHLPLSIDISDWTYRKRDGLNKKIAWINHNWSAKGLPLMLQAFAKLLKTDNAWELHIVCDWSSEYWFPSYIHHIIKELGIGNNVQFHGKVSSIDVFLDSFDYVVSSSYKEAFSLILAEAAAKGIKILTHNWEGAKDIWPENLIWTTVDEFVEKIQGEYNSEYYRSLAEKYDKKFELETVDKIIEAI